jgi:chorismate dehydratase
MTRRTVERKWRLGVVSYLNARPLIAGLEGDDDLELVYAVPSRLAGMLDEREVDVALVPVVDLLRRGDAWRIVSDACIGCDGETLTVRVFSRILPEEITRLHVDGDSHTSVALAQVLWREQHDRQLEVVRFQGNETVDQCHAVLLIGDKVVTRTLIDYDIEIDLGAEWKSLTSLPFVFAVWAAQRNADVAGLASRLAAARDRGVRAAPMIAEDVGPGMGWPVRLAQRYLMHRLRFTLGPRYLEAMQRFAGLMERHGVLSRLGEVTAA